MLRRRTLKTILFFLVFSIVIVFTASYINEKTSKVKSQEQKVAEQLAIENQKKLDEELLRAKIIKANNFVKSISNETEIIVLSENGEYTINHDRTPENNWYSEWLNNAEISIKFDYRTIFSMKTANINFTVTSKGAVNINYDTREIGITAIDISNVIPSQKTSLFGSKYKPTEVTALEDIAKEKVRSESYNDDNISKANTNLKSFINDWATKFDVDDICIISENANKVYDNALEVLK